MGKEYSGGDGYGKGSYEGQSYQADYIICDDDVDRCLSILLSIGYKIVDPSNTIDCDFSGFSLPIEPEQSKNI